MVFPPLGRLGDQHPPDNTLAERTQNALQANMSGGHSLTADVAEKKGLWLVGVRQRLSLIFSRKAFQE